MSEGHTLRSRVPGQSAMSNIVARQRALPARQRLARVFGKSPLTAENRRIYRGALGELLVGDTVDHLGPSWDVLHAVPADANNYEIDHLVIGPPGVFTILTQNHSGQEVVVDGETILVAGRRDDQARTARFEAESAAALLSSAAGRPVLVQPIIVSVNPKRLLVRNQPSGISIVSSRELERFFARLERQLDGPEVAFVSDVADRPTTWHFSPAAYQDTTQLRRDFSDLRAEVTTAAGRRLLWGALAFVVVCALTWGSVALIVAHVIEV
jgi:hypothetical protein